MIQILKLHAQFHAYENIEIEGSRLVFSTSPCGVAPPVPDTQMLNTGPYALRSSSTQNFEFISLEENLLDLLTRVDACVLTDETKSFIDGLRQAAEDKFQALQQLKMEEWRRQQLIISKDDVVNPGMCCIYSRCNALS